jgi:nitrogen regulatory protein P-II 1
MKEIKAFVRPGKIQEVVSNLRKAGHLSLTVFKGEGTGDYTDPDKEWPSLDLPFLHSKVIKLEIVCDNNDVNSIVELIRTHGRTGKSGDGLIYITDINETIRIREKQK